MPLSLALVFHLNQHTSEYADVANRACYRGLLNVLRAHPTLKFNLHLSGTLLRALNWFDPATLDLIRAGLADGQFELLGGTYAQNVPYASEDWDNAQQIGLHRAVLERAFNLRPTVFWNAERAWRQTLVPLIAQGGYTTTLVEDHVLRAAGLADPLPVTTTCDKHSLTVVCDDTLLRDRFNYAAWFGRRAQLFKYLDAVAARPGSGDFVVAYAEDAEAMGLWSWEEGYLPQSAWAGLDALLSDFEKSAAYALVHLSSAKPRQALSPLPDRAAQWMDAALLNPRAKFHEAGYLNWFDFLARSPKVAYFRRLHSVMRSCLQAFGASSGDPGYSDSRKAVKPPARFYRQGIEALCHHQYEFGCIGVGGRNYWGWENVRATFLFCRVAQIAANPRPEHWIEDVNGDGSDEQILCDARYLAVLTAHGGRLVHWFDLRQGRQLMGNQLAVPAAHYPVGTTEQPRLAPQPRVWLPESFEADLKPWRSLRARERAPTRLGRLLPDWVFRGEPRALTVYRRRMKQSGERPPVRAQMGALNDEMAINDRDAFGPDALLDYRMESDGPCYLCYLKPDFVVEKRVRQTPDGLAVHYAIDNRARSARRLRMRFSSELNPDYAEVLAGGRAALSFFMYDDLYPGVVNNVTRNAIVLETSREWADLGHSFNLLAIEIWLTFEVSVPGRAPRELEIQMRVVKV